MKRLFSILTIAAFVATPNISIAQDSALVLEEVVVTATKKEENVQDCLLYTSPSPRDLSTSRMPSSA